MNGTREMKMSNLKIEKTQEEEIATLTLEISNRLGIISKTFDDRNDPILKNLAAAAIHLTMFMRDFYNSITDEKLDINETLDNEFLEECGCNPKTPK